MYVDTIVVKAFIKRDINRNSCTTWHWLYRMKLFREISSAVLKGRGPPPCSFVLPYVRSETYVCHLGISSQEGIFVGVALH